MFTFTFDSTVYGNLSMWLCLKIVSQDCEYKYKIFIENYINKIVIDIVIHVASAPFN